MLVNPLVKPLEQGSIQNQVSYIGILTLSPTNLTGGPGQFDYYLSVKSGFPVHGISFCED